MIILSIIDIEASGFGAGSCWGWYVANMGSGGTLLLPLVMIGSIGAQLQSSYIIFLTTRYLCMVKVLKRLQHS